MRKGLPCFAIVAVALAAVGCRDTNVTDTGNQQDSGRDVPIGSDIVNDNGQDVVVPPDAPVDGGNPTVTIRQVQDLADSAHPAPGSHLNMDPTGLVALTGRVALSSTPDSSGRCRFAFWMGNGTTGPFAGIQVQETPLLGDAGNCFAVNGAIPYNLAPGEAITTLDNVTYSEFCAGPSGTPTTACRNFEQTQLFIARTGSTLAIGTAGAAPTPTTATVPQLAGASGGPGTMALDLEGDLVVVNGARVFTQLQDSGFSNYYLVDPSDTTNTNLLQIIVSNFPRTACVRTYLAAQNGNTISSVTGVLEPNYGWWTIRIRDEHDIAGLTCTTDGGIPDAGTGIDAGGGG